MEVEENPPVEDQAAPVPVLQPAPALLAAKRVIKLKVIPVVTVVLLCAILIGELTPDYTVWIDKIRNMDGNAWMGAVFVGIGDVTALLLIYSPIDTVFTVLIEGTIGHRLLEPYVAALCNCFVWTLYGGETVSYSVLGVNGAGCVFYLVYTVVMVRKGNSVAFGVLRLTLLIIGAFAVGGCYLDAGYGCNKAAIIGWSGALLSFTMYLVPAIQNFINVQEMPLQMVVASMLNASVWTAYGVTIGDKRMWMPSGLGFLLCLTQLLVYFSTRRAQDPKVELSEEQEELLRAE